jgi:hypothetical protein
MSKLKLIKGGKNYATELEKAREKLGERLEAFTPLMDKIFIDFGIPMDYAVKNWTSFMMGLDQLLAEHFSLEPDEEDK